MVPDYISQEEFIRSFRWDKFVTIYRFLVNDVGLDILPEDLGMTDSDLSYPDVDKIDMFIGLNTVVDPMINKIQADIMR